MANITRPPVPSATARFGFTGPRFLLTVDTEEEFDWDAPLNRESYTLDHLPALAPFQSFCEAEGVTPIYMVDWPVANDDRAAAILRPALARGTAEIGIQLHPWVNPPLEEALTDRNSYAGNLPAALEEAKFLVLKERIETAFDARSCIYRAGRYGAGPATAEMLLRHGIGADSSVRPLFDYSGSGGPDYRAHPTMPYWIDADRRLLELPLTTAFWGLLRRQGGSLYPSLWRMPALRGVLSRLGLLERVPLTPEGTTFEEAVRCIDMVLDDANGTNGAAPPVLNISFHSPSLMQGKSPYARSASEVAAIHDWLARVFAYLRLRGVEPTTVAALLESAGRARPAAMRKTGAG